MTIGGRQGRAVKRARRILGLILAGLMACGNAPKLEAESFVLDGGDIEERQISPSDCAHPLTKAILRDCQPTTQEIVTPASCEEAERVRRNLLIRSSIMTSLQALDVASTAWFKARYACKDTAPGQLCVVEANQAFPLTVGLIAGKVIYTVGGAILEYELDKRGKDVWAKVATLIVSLAGLLPAAWNIYQGIRVDKANAVVGR
jgi:hypothetical protein